jgi:hypothetical protein
MVFLQLTGGEVEQDDAIDRLFARYKSPKPGMLYTVTENRVKVRQLPASSDTNGRVGPLHPLSPMKAYALSHRLPRH